MICRSNRPSRSLAVMVLPDPAIDMLFLLLGNPIDGIAEYVEDMDDECVWDELGRWASVAMAERY